MNIALLLAGGRGTRLGASIPKQYLEVAGRPVIAYSMEPFFGMDEIDAIQIVADLQWHSLIQEWIWQYDRAKKFRGFSQPGQTRQLSIKNALIDMDVYADRDDVVVIHDAARPCLSKDMLLQYMEKMKEDGIDGVIPTIPVKDTMYLSRDGKQISSLLNRDMIYVGQAPELFRFGKYKEANIHLPDAEIRRISGSTEAAVMYGMKIAMIPGNEMNYKITTKADIERFCESV